MIIHNRFIGKPIIFVHHCAAPLSSRWYCREVVSIINEFVNVTSERVELLHEGEAFDFVTSSSLPQGIPVMWWIWTYMMMMVMRLMMQLRLAIRQWWMRLFKMWTESYLVKGSLEKILTLDAFHFQ
jgi:hypothetical protein